MIPVTAPTRSGPDVTDGIQAHWIRTGESFGHAQEVAKPFGVLDEMLDWCKANLTQEWRWQLIRASSGTENGRYIFYFDSDKDKCAFCLRWM